MRTGDGTAEDGAARVGDHVAGGAHDHAAGDGAVRDVLHVQALPAADEAGEAEDGGAGGAAGKASEGLLICDG